MTQSSTTESGNTLDFLRDSRIADPLRDALHNAYANAVTELGTSPAGWHDSNDIKTLEGLGGSYFWSENLLQMARIAFRFDPGHPGSRGSYEIISGSSTIELGTFQCMPNNPAIVCVLETKAGGGGGSARHLYGADGGRGGTGPGRFRR